MKRLALIIMTIMVLLSTIACSSEKGIIGTWKYDRSENSDPDMQGVSIDIRESVMYLSNNIDGHEMTMECTYEKDNETIYVTEMSSNGRTISNDEFLEISYRLLDDKLMLDMEEMGLGKVIFCRANN